MEIFGENVELIRVVRVVGAVRAIRAVTVIRVVRAQALYKESGEKDFSQSCLDCHGRNIAGLSCFEAFFELSRKKEEFVSTRVVGLKSETF